MSSGGRREGRNGDGRGRIRWVVDSLGAWVIIMKCDLEGGWQGFIYVLVSLSNQSGETGWLSHAWRAAHGPQIYMLVLRSRHLGARDMGDSIEPWTTHVDSRTHSLSSKLPQKLLSRTENPPTGAIVEGTPIIAQKDTLVNL